MAAPAWWAELMAVSDVLAAEDRAELAKWRGEPQPGGEPHPGEPQLGGEPEDSEADEPPLTVRLGALGQAFAEHAAELTPQQRRGVLGALERVLASGDEYESTAVATGFLEALLAASDDGFDLRSVWTDLGPESQRHLLAWNEFSGVDTPEWMRRTDLR
jgi:hypothetical protein